MRFSFGVALSALIALGACAPEGDAPAPSEQAAMLAPFEDGGCLGHLLLYRSAVIEGRAQGDVGALDRAIEAWRARGLQSLSADELAQYEASSVATQDDAAAATIAAEAESCVANPPAL